MLESEKFDVKKFFRLGNMNTKVVRVEIGRVNDNWR